MSILLILFINTQCFSQEYIDIKDTSNGYTQIIYHTDNGKSYNLELKIKDLKNEKKIKEWFDEVAPDDSMFTDDLLK